MIGLKTSYEIAYNGTENECRFELYADSAADLQGLTHFDGIKIQMGSECTDIATGDKYLLNGSGVWVLQPDANAWENVYTKAEIDSMVNAIYQVMMYYHTAQESSDGTITFYTFGGNVGSLTIYGNGQQSGTPTPENPVMPEFVGTLDNSDWTVPITCAGQTVPVYLGQVSTVRRVKKLVLDGTENWGYSTSGNNARVYLSISAMPESPSLSTHYKSGAIRSYPYLNEYCINSASSIVIGVDKSIITSAADFKAFLAAQYASGNPVTVWYVLAEQTTGIVNEPLAKIRDYADELHSTDAAITIPTVSGENTLTVDTTLKPSKIIISGER